MADSSTHLDVLTDEEIDGIVARIMELLDAASPAMTFGRHASLCVDFTFAVYGGKKFTGDVIPEMIANATFDLSPYPSTTVYIYNNADGTWTLSEASPEDSPSGAASTSELVYGVTTDADGITGWTDYRTRGSGSGGGSGSIDSVVTVTEVGDDLLFTRISDGKQFLLGPFE